jgi:hypothetical protein
VDRACSLELSDDSISILTGGGSQSVLATVTGDLRVLDEIGRCGGQQAERVCRYLTSVSTPDGALPLLHHSLRGYPYAPGRMVVFDAPGDLLSTAPVVGLLHRAAVWHAWLFRATDFCWAAVEALGQAGAARASEVVAAAAFLDDAPDRPRAEAAAHRLGCLVRARGLAVLDPGRPGAMDAGADGERCAVHEFVRTPSSLARRWFTDAELERSLEHLSASQQDDGGWPAPGRAWAAGPHLERRPVATIDALLTLRAHDRLPVVTR